MDVYCNYDNKLEKFLQMVVDYTLELYGKDLNLSLLNEIELVKKETFSFYTDGRVVENGRKIILTSHLYENLDNYDIQEIKDTESFKTIVRTVYHEMGHISDMRRFPKLYSSAINDKNLKEVLPSFFWLEYLAERRSCKISLKIDNDYCEDFVAREWKVRGLNLQSASEDNFFYLNKALAYFLARILENNKFSLYTRNLKNNILREYITDLKAEILRLEEKAPFDSIETLDDLFEIMKNNLKKFVNKDAC